MKYTSFEILDAFRRRLTVKKRRVLTNTGWLILDRGVRMAAGLYVGLRVARYLGPDQFGLMSYATAFVLLFTPLVSLGLDNVVVRELIRRPGEDKSILGSAFLLRMFTGLGAWSTVIVLVTFIRPGDTLLQYLVALIAAGGLFQAADVIDYWFQSSIKSGYVVIARGIAFLGASIARLYLVHIGADLLAFAWVGLVEVAANAAALAIVYRTQGGRLSQWRPGLFQMKTLLSQSWPLLLTGIAIMLYMKVDQVMLGEMIDNRTVGIYSAAVRLSELWYVVPMSILASLFPVIVHTRTISEELYLQRIQKVFDLMSALSMAIVLPIFIFARPIVSWTFGPNFAEAAGVLRVHVLATPFVFLGMAHGMWEINENLTRLSFQKTMIGAVMNIALNLWLIPHYGATGAAIATLISYLVVNTVLIGVFSRTRPMFIMQVRSLLFFRRLPGLLKGLP